MTKTHIYLSYFLGIDTPLYGNGNGILINTDKSISKGDSANTKLLSFPNHACTHIDFPNHFFDNGKVSNSYDASFWIFEKPHLIEIKSEEDDLIDFDEKTLESIPKDTDFLIIKTGFYQYRNEEKYWKNNPGLSPDLAKKIRKRCEKLRVIGGDFISITAYQKRDIGKIAHRAFLGEFDILLVEDMKLDMLITSPQHLICTPLLVKNVDGVPVTVIASV